MSKRLLVHVDDDLDEAFLFQRALTRGGIAGWSYRHFADAPGTMEYLRQAKMAREAAPDLMVVDLNMPRVSGLELLEWVVDNFPGLPVVILSSSDLLQDRLRARNLGSRGYFVKSSAHDELMAFLREWQSSAAQPLEQAM
jgi:DNA-binding response OmpR family regulator